MQVVNSLKFSKGYISFYYSEPSPKLCNIKSFVGLFEKLLRDVLSFAFKYL